MRIFILFVVLLVPASVAQGQAAGAVAGQHWSFVAPRRAGQPAVHDTNWPHGSIDRFILARLEALRLAPAPEADRQTLIRRLSLDLVGLPPSPDEVDRFVEDENPDAYERLVDRLLASPHYGERMGRIWLDLARYADSSGYANDNVRSIWPYRDWVIHAFNEDMPFDRFTIEQLAGDMFHGATQDQIIASGFHRNTPHQYEGGSDPEQYRVERVKNRVDTTGTVWLGLTVACAQCHTHKFDPITQREYYGIYAFFNSADEPTLSLPTPEQQAELAGLDAQLAEARVQLSALSPGDQHAQLEKAIAGLEDKRRNMEGAMDSTLVLRELDTPRETHLQVRGDFLSPGDMVGPGTLSVLHEYTPPADRAANRLDFARWLLEAENPLTARVTVNRVWQHHFGLGLVETENDFGAQGERPSHPELLDWLALEFIDRGWSFKRLHRLVVCSAAYRQSSHFRADLADADPQNRFIARQSRHRVEAEVIRDLALAASGLLCRKLGGPSVFPPIPPNVLGASSANHTWPTSEGANRYRRGLYTAVYRATVYPMLSTFDGPDRDNACTRRSRSNTPLQSLAMANETALVEITRGLGLRVLREGPADDMGRVRFAFETCMGRKPTANEQERLLAFYREQHAHYAADEKAARIMAGENPPASVTLAEVSACMATARVLVNLDEFITRE